MALAEKENLLKYPLSVSKLLSVFAEKCFCGSVIWICQTPYFHLKGKWMEIRGFLFGEVLQSLYFLMSVTFGQVTLFIYKFAVAGVAFADIFLGIYLAEDGSLGGVATEDERFHVGIEQG